MRLAATPVFLAGFASAINVYLNPPLPASTSLSGTPELSPSEARIVLAHHLRLEGHESATDDELEFLEDIIGGFGNDIVQGPKNTLLLSMDESIVKCKFTSQISGSQA